MIFDVNANSLAILTKLQELNATFKTIDYSYNYISNIRDIKTLKTNNLPMLLFGNYKVSFYGASNSNAFATADEYYYVFIVANHDINKATTRYKMNDYWKLVISKLMEIDGIEMGDTTLMSDE